jgi:hypothetical protein
VAIMSRFHALIAVIANTSWASSPSQNAGAEPGDYAGATPDPGT